MGQLLELPLLEVELQHPHLVDLEQRPLIRRQPSDLWRVVRLQHLAPWLVQLQLSVLEPLHPTLLLLHSLAPGDEDLHLQSFISSSRTRARLSCDAARLWKVTNHTLK